MHPAAQQEADPVGDLTQRILDASLWTLVVCHRVQALRTSGGLYACEPRRGHRCDRAADGGTHGRGGRQPVRPRHHEEALMTQTWRALAAIASAHNTSRGF